MPTCAARIIDTSLAPSPIAKVIALGSYFFTSMTTRAFCSGDERHSTTARHVSASSTKRAASSVSATPPSAARKHAENDAGDDLASRVNKHTKLNQPHKVLELYNATTADERPEALPLVVRALLRMRCVEAALALHRRHSSESTAPLDTRSACVLFLALCRTGRLDEATEMLSELERSHPPPEESVAAKIVKAMNAAGGEVGGGMMASSSAAPMEDAVEEPMWHAISSTMVPALALARAHALRLKCE